MKTLVVAGVATLAVLGGVAIGATVGTPDVASAQEDTTETTESTQSTEPSTEPSTEAERPEHVGLAEVLADLVEDGTLTQEQADAVEEAITSRMGPGMGRFGHHHGFGVGLDAAAEAIGIEADELRSALMDGQTLAEVAEANGVERQAVVDALVAEAESRIDQALEDERIDEDQATELRERAATKAEDAVDGTLRERGFRHRHGPTDGTDQTEDQDTAGGIEDQSGTDA